MRTRYILRSLDNLYIAPETQVGAPSLCLHRLKIVCAWLIFLYLLFMNCRRILETVALACHQGKQTTVYFFFAN